MRFALPAFGFLAAAAFWPTILDGALAPRWAAIAVMAPLLLLLLPGGARAPLRGGGLLLLAMIGASIAWSPDPFRGADEFVHLLILATVFVLGASLSDLRPIWTGVFAGISVSAAIAVAQVAGWDGIPNLIHGWPGGLFVNKNMLAEAGVIALVAAVMLKQWAWVPGLALAAVLPLSWNALGALAVAGAVWAMTYHRGVGLAALAMIGLAAAAFFTWGMVHPESFAGAKIALRLQTWSSAMAALTWAGHGFGSFAVAYPSMEFAHNEIVQLLYELGIFAMPVVGLFIFALWGSNEADRLVVIAIGAMCLLSFPLHMPFTACMAALAVGHLVRDRVLVRSVQLDRGSYAGLSLQR